ncbi:MAG: LysR family transcriptional regulator [Oscillospiraceae bacterium]
MEIKQLRSFIAVADTLSFSRAAEIMFLSQPALSRQIQELERELGVPLLTRTTRQVTLTAAGEEFRRRAKEIISRLEKIPPDVKKLAGRARGEQLLHIGMDARVIRDPGRRKVITDAVYAMRKQYPGLRALFHLLDYRGLIERLTDGRLDCALILDRELETDETIHGEVIGSEEMVLAFRSAHTHTDADFASVMQNRGLILVEREERGLYHIVQILSSLDLQPQIRFCAALEDMTMTVATGESAAILPQSIVREMNDPAMQALPLPTKFAQLTYAFLTRADNENEMVREFFRRIKTH